MWPGLIIAIAVVAVSGCGAEGCRADQKLLRQGGWGHWRPAALPADADRHCRPHQAQLLPSRRILRADGRLAGCHHRRRSVRGLERRERARARARQFHVPSAVGICGRWWRWRTSCELCSCHRRTAASAARCDAAAGLPLWQGVLPAESRAQGRVCPPRRCDCIDALADSGTVPPPPPAASRRQPPPAAASAASADAIHRSPYRSLTPRMALPLATAW